MSEFEMPSAASSPWAMLKAKEAENEQLRAALQAIADDPDTDAEAAAYARHTLASLASAEQRSAKSALSATKGTEP